MPRAYAVLYESRPGSSRRRGRHRPNRSWVQRYEAVLHATTPAPPRSPPISPPLSYALSPNRNEQPKVTQLIARRTLFCPNLCLQFPIRSNTKETPRAVNSLLLIVSEGRALRVEDVLPGVLDLRVRAVEKCQCLMLDGTASPLRYATSRVCSPYSQTPSTHSSAHSDAPPSHSPHHFPPTPSY